MKLGELNMHCGECSIIEMCGEPYSNVSLCTREALEDMTEEEYAEQYNKIAENGKSEYLDNVNNEEFNSEIMEMICEKAT